MSLHLGEYRYSFIRSNAHIGRLNVCKTFMLKFFKSLSIYCGMVCARLLVECLLVLTVPIVDSIQVVSHVIYLQTLLLACC